jgi:hypothetical protein
MRYGLELRVRVKGYGLGLGLGLGLDLHSGHELVCELLVLRGGVGSEVEQLLVVESRCIRGRESSLCSLFRAVQGCVREPRGRAESAEHRCAVTRGRVGVSEWCLTATLEME